MNAIKRLISLRRERKLLKLKSRVNHISDALKSEKLQWWTQEQYIAERINLRVQIDMIDKKRLESEDQAV